MVQRLRTGWSRTASARPETPYSDHDRRRCRDDIEVLDAADAEHFRRALGQFATGVVIVSAIDGGEPVRVACQSF
jgi:3-hydroxy-9,10-secoandrosta-1,3,5(10)-triene-9,17-dione monooxygenase reductase component